MEPHEESGARRAGDHTAEDVDADRTHPAGPATPDSGFAEGVEQKPDSPEEELEPDFARGIRQGDDDGQEVQGKFSRGAEQLPDTPDKNVERRFSEGIEQRPHDN